MSEPAAASLTLPLRHCYWVIPGLLLAGEHPNGPTRDKTKDRLKKLLGAGIECFVDLTKPTELLRYDTFLPFYVEYTRKSIKDHGLPSGRSQMTEILEYIANSMRAGRPVYVHCRAGIGRTGTVVGCLLAERGMQGDAAIDELNRLWQQNRRSRSWPFIPETDAQAKFVREWKPSMEGGFELSSLATAVATVGSMSADASIRGAKAGVAGAGPGTSAAAARSGGAGLRAAAEQARAAVVRGEVQVKAPPTPPTTSPAITPPLSAPQTHPATPDLGLRVDLQKGEISPSLRAEITDAIAGRGPSLPVGRPDAGPGARASAVIDTGLRAAAAGDGAHAGSGATAAGSRIISGSVAPFVPGHGTALPNAGEEVPWAEVELPAEIGATVRPTTGSNAVAAARPTTGPSASAAGAPTAGTHPAAAATPAAGEPAGARPRSNGYPADLSSPSVSDARPSSGAGTRSPAAYHPPVDHAAEVDPLLDPDTLAAARSMRERFVGTLFGLAVGDAVAAATQFRRPGTFSPVGDMLGGGPFDLPRGAWSDDTAMALCLAESLLERDGFDARDQVQRYSRWQQEGYLTSTGQCVGITANTARSLALAKWRRGLVFPGSHDPEQLDPEPLSRIASIALFYVSSLDTTLLQAVDSARITCQAPAVLDACRRFARALNVALSGQSKSKILAEGGPFTEAAAQSNNSAASALAAALWAFSSTDNFRDAVLRAANVGGNSDVVATVCGQLAGAHYGATAIPQSWRSGLIQKDLIEGIADRLLAHALVSLSR